MKILILKDFNLKILKFLQEFKAAKFQQDSELFSLLLNTETRFYLKLIFL